MAETVFDPYATLAVRRGADPAEVRKAYRRLARLHHPDRSGDGRTTERMQAINRAWAILSNPARRANHDASMASAHQPSRGHWSGARTRTAYWAPPPASWSSGAAAVPPYRSPIIEDDPSWRGILGAILLLVFVAPVLFVILPLPFSGLFVLLVAGALTRSGGE